MRIGQVLRYCLTIMKPGRTILFTNRDLAPKAYPWDVVKIPDLTWQSYNLFINRVVPLHVKTGFAMSVHEDGFPVDPSQWRPEFLHYDYIGAPWNDNVVGNGGFNIESQVLLQAKVAAEIRLDDFVHPSDRWVCTCRRKEFEDRGIRFAPLELAMQFSTEQIGGERPSFGFHGRQASAAKYRKGWQMINAMPVREHQGFNLVRNKVVARAPLGKAPLARPTIAARYPEPSITLIYTHVLGSPEYVSLAQRFVKSYAMHPPRQPHKTIVLCNGGGPTEETRKLFQPLGEAEYFLHDNTGWDIGGYLKVAKTVDTDLMFCLASSAHVRRGGWLRRIVEAYTRHGPGIYGTLASYEVQPHFCTTGFAIPPKILREYAQPIMTKADRYDFEHGVHSPVRMAIKRRQPVILVTWDGEYQWQSWRRPANVYAKGDQSNLLTFFRHSDSYETGSVPEKRRRQNLADTNSRPSFLR